MSDRNRVRLAFAVWDNEGNNWSFSGYGCTDGSDEAYADHRRLILMRVPELIGKEEDAWDYEYSIRR